MSLKVLLQCLICFISLTLLQAEPEILVLYNKKVPTGKGLAYDYADFRKLSTNVMFGLDLPTHESISKKTYLDCFKNQLSERLEARRPEVILSVYGLPLWVEDGERVRSFDQLLTLSEGVERLDERLILNPLIQSPVPPFAEALIRVSRLDGPSIRQAQMMLHQWKELANIGCWRRYGMSGIDEALSQLMRQRGFWVEEKPALDLITLNELQFLHTPQGQMRELYELHSKDRLPPGAMLLRYHSASFGDGDFRSLGESDASAACMLGVSFFIGAHKILRAEEDLFDPLLFFLKFSKGESFIDAAYAAMPNLGGSMLLLGDPLAKPFSEASIALQRTYYETNQLEDPDENELKQFNDAKDWWLVHDYFDLWNKGKIDLVIANLKMAIIKRRSRLFFEHLARRYKQMGQREKMKSWLRKWPEKKRTSWDKHVLEMMGY